jgi:hypothetical protein
MLVARTPNKLHVQAVEKYFNENWKDTSLFLFCKSAKLEAMATRILARVFSDGK